jgi:alpha/beta superfamily hydrolase
MRYIMKKLFVLLFFISNIAISALSPDYAKEARWAEQVEESILDGDSVWLSADEHEFLTIFTEDESEGNEAAIIVHGTGVHPNWTQVIQPLRVGLTENGFNTLSIQMPVLENGMHGEDYMPLFPGADRRIMSAVKYLKDEGFNPTTLIAHSLGTTMSTHFLANNEHTFEKFVGVGMGERAVEYLSSIDIAILDLYGNEDLESVLNSTKDKMNASKHNQNYTQKMVNTDHFFNGQDELLVSEVSAWLK